MFYLCVCRVDGLRVVEGLGQILGLVVGLVVGLVLGLSDVGRLDDGSGHGLVLRLDLRLVGRHVAV